MQQHSARMLVLHVIAHQPGSHFVLAGNSAGNKHPLVAALEQMVGQSLGWSCGGKPLSETLWHKTQQSIISVAVH
jgi:hypothetical protein